MEVAVSKGFLVLAENTESEDYVKQAYALALSIKSSQQNVTDISIVTNDVVPDEYQKVFDKIIPIPWCDTVIDSRYKVENRWKLYHVTPYEETIVLDTDMLMLEDISLWWEYCQPFDVKYCSRILNHKLEETKDTEHRKPFILNNLTNPYAALHYFKKTQAAYEFYKIVEFVCNNWEWAYGKIAPVAYQDWLSMDMTVAVAIEIFGDPTVVAECCPFEFVHMKPSIQSWDNNPASWRDNVPFVLTSKGQLIVGNIKQPKLFHYVEKDFLSKGIIKKLETIVYGKEKN